MRLAAIVYIVLRTFLGELNATRPLARWAFARSISPQPRSEVPRHHGRAAAGLADALAPAKPARVGLDAPGRAKSAQYRARAGCRAKGRNARSSRSCRPCGVTWRKGAQADLCADRVLGMSASGIARHARHGFRRMILIELKVARRIGL